MSLQNSLQQQRALWLRPPCTRTSRRSCANDGCPSALCFESTQGPRAFQQWLPRSRGRALCKFTHGCRQVLCTCNKGAAIELPEVPGPASKACAVHAHIRSAEVTMRWPPGLTCSKCWLRFHAPCPTNRNQLAAQVVFVCLHISGVLPACLHAPVPLSMPRIICRVPG